ncbi:MAG: hypothetical protein NC206_04585 [Bacteroides sp.]|nr:hypothetical protein [Roseburia sp.]MCM1346341.1 hypothetical protein [Bacteroides sp.]MCM1420930.1 hypothetical protein [Bacteroides sp.]
MKTKHATGIFMPLVIIIAAWMGCTGEQKKAEEKVAIQPIMELPDIMEATGTVGDGTSMNVLELVDEDGDTLLLNMPISSITGGAESGDDLNVIYTVSAEGDMTASVAINLTALQHLWTQPNGKGGSQSLEITADGKAATYDMSIEYDSWKLEDGLLLLHSPKKVGEESGEIVDTFQIMKLTNKELVLMSHEMESVFRRGN